MAEAVRRVRRLRLRGGSEAALRRAELALGDALRTASLPDEGGRLLLVRRLALGPIRERARPGQVVGALERAMAEATNDCRHGLDPTAASASAVWFADALEAHLALARRLLAGPAPRAWYWRLVAPGWGPDAEPSAGLRALARSLAELPEARAALPAWVDALARDGHERAVVEALGPADVETISRALGRARRPEEEGVPEGVRPGRGAEGDPGRRETPRATLPSDEPDAAARLVADILREMRGEGASSIPGREGDDATGGEVVPPPGTPGDPLVRPASGGASTPSGQDLTRTGGKPFERARGAARPGETHGAPGQARGIEGVDHASGAPPDADAHRDGASNADLAAPAGRHAWPGLATTEAGGIGFVINVLDRLDLGAWIEARPEWARREVGRRVLARVLAALGLPREDPMRAWAERADDRTALPREAAVVRAWTVAAHGWLRHHSGLRMRELVLRPGHVALSRTHMDVWLDPTLGDLRIRRAGLDLDPGWVPWLGRVVAFHYEARGSR